MPDFIKISAVSEMTFRRVKEPAFMILFVISGLIGYAVSEMKDFSFNADDSILAGIIAAGHGSQPLSGFVIIFMLSLLVAVFTGATDIPRDIDSRMVMLILAKPVRRSEYLIGKYLGSLSICIAFFLVASLVAGTAHFIKNGELFPPGVLFRQFFLLLAFFPFTAMTVMFSTFFADISAMIVTVVYLMFSIMLSSLVGLIELLPEGMPAVDIVYPFYYLFPNYLYYLNAFSNVGLTAVALVVYSFSVTLIFLLIASFRMKNRDMI
jgi:ABC-type transport system involved in multi-copper enzyme maturation permease subunit